MSAKLNKIFFNTYIEADKLCCAKFGVERGGINEYINKLINSRFASDREDTLNHLTKYRDIRNVLAHEAGAMSADESLVRSDVKWMQGFTSDLHYKRDPLSKYLRRARGYLRFRRIVSATVILLIAAALTFVYFSYFR